MQQCNQRPLNVFASPRVRRSTFIKYLERNGIKPEQVLVVTTHNDYPHWPTDLLTDPLEAAQYGQNPLSAIAPEMYDYESSQGKYYYMTLVKDITSTLDGSDPVLGHGGMIDGAIKDRIYNVRSNGKVLTEVRLRDRYHDFINGAF